MHAGALAIFDPSISPEPFNADRFREIIAARLHRLVPFRQRLVPTPLGSDRRVRADDRYRSSSRLAFATPRSSQ